MPLTTAWKTKLIKLIHKGVNPMSGISTVYVSLHTADPTATGNQSTSEVAYTGYARVAVAVGSGTWSDITNGVTNSAGIFFPTVLAGTAPTSHWGIGTAASGTGELIEYGPVNAGVPRTFITGDIPTIPVSQMNLTG